MTTTQYKTIKMDTIMNDDFEDLFDYDTEDEEYIYDSFQINDENEIRDFIKNIRGNNEE